MANLATKRGVEGHRITIHTPLIDLSKTDMVKRGLELGVHYSLTRSCDDPSPDGEACGECDSCQLRLRGFSVNGITDPAPNFCAQRRKKLMPTVCQQRLPRQRTSRSSRSSVRRSRVRGLRRVC